MKKLLLLSLPLALLLWLLFLPACHKDPPLTIIKGRVTEFGTGLPIEGARIYVLCDNGVIFGPSGSSLADSLITDADGRFYREYAEDALCGSVFLLPYKEGFFVGTRIYLTTLNKELDIILDPEAWLKFVTVPDGANDYDHIGVGGDFRFEAFASQGSMIKIFITPGNREKSISWEPFSDPTLIMIDTLYVSAHDTITYTIHY